MKCVGLLLLLCRVVPDHTDLLGLKALLVRLDLLAHRERRE